VICVIQAKVFVCKTISEKKREKKKAQRRDIERNTSKAI
jgi:hypothetical protein